MPRHFKVIGFTLVLLLGAYGCAKGPGSTSSADSGEATAKVKKLEDDYRAAVSARDQFRQKLVAAEDQQAKVQKELATTVAERDALKGEVKARTAERDALQSQFEAFRKTLKDLLGNADAAVGALNLPPLKPAADQAAQK
jgi:septal ring factor EnvC (AmiA/AmiB activator)